MNYQTKSTLQEIAVYALTFGVLILAALGVAILINSGNVNIEAKCQAAGGQVLKTPGEISKCLLPARWYATIHKQPTNQLKHMDCFDDIQIEESVGFDFAEACYDGLFDEEENNSKTFDSFLNSNYDY